MLVVVVNCVSKYTTGFPLSPFQKITELFQYFPAETLKRFPEFCRSPNRSYLLRLLYI